MLPLLQQSELRVIENVGVFLVGQHQSMGTDLGSGDLYPHSSLFQHFVDQHDVVVQWGVHLAEHSHDDIPFLAVVSVELGELPHRHVVKIAMIYAAARHRATHIGSLLVESVAEAQNMRVYL